MNEEPTLEIYKQEWLTDVREGSPSTTDLGRRFTHKILTQWLDIGNVSDDIVYCDGSNDGGIDAAYLDRGEATEGDAGETAEGHTWYLVQSKYGAAFQGTATLLSESTKVIETLDGERQHLSSLAEGLLARLQTFQAQASERDRIVLVFATEDPLSEAHRRVLNDVRNMGRGRLGNLFDVDAVAIRTIYLRTLEESADIALKVPLTGKLVPSEEDLLVGAVSLRQLYDFLKAYRSETEDLDRLYEKNVRRFLGSRGRVNKAMQKTLQEEPERFGLYNNGITLVTENFDIQEDGKIVLVEPYIVNGCQTTRTIWEVFHRRLEAGGTGYDADIEEWRQKASQSVLVTKIVRVGSGGETLLKKITRFTNSQNAVREKDFLALTQDFRTWQDGMAQNYGVYLEIQRGGWDSQRAWQRQHPDSQPQFTESANAFDLLKVYGAAWLTEPGTAFGKNGPFLPEGRIFRRIVNDGVGKDSFNEDDLYAAYQLKNVADGYRFGRGADKASRRLTRFLFYMVVIELLRDVLVRTTHSPTLKPKQFTRAIIKLFHGGSEQAIEALLDAAIQVVDEYAGPDGFIFQEPPYHNAFNSDTNAYLKWEQFGKSEDASPHLHSLIKDWQRLMGRRTGGQPSPLELLTDAIHD